MEPRKNMNNRDLRFINLSIKLKKQFLTIKRELLEHLIVKDNVGNLTIEFQEFRILCISLNLNILTNENRQNTNHQ